MASPRSTRSSKNEVLTTKTRSSHNIATAPHVTRHSNNNRPSPQTANSHKKRDRDALDAIKEEGPIKKVRYAVEIESRPIALFPQPKASPVVAESKPEGLPQRKATPPPRRTSTKNTKTQPAEPPQPTIHHQKVANGIKHELDRLQPSEADAKDEKRKLRSQEGTRFKSELSRYFPDYDEVIGNDPKEEHFLNHDTPIIILDNAKTSAKQNNPSPASSQRKLNDFPIKTYPDSLFNKLNEAHRVDFSFLDTHCKDKEGKNPLPDSYYQTVHRKPERNEKLVRNTDKGKAQHEKDQVIRLLEGLQGHDWLKVLGVSGITESRKKEFEPARDHFIKGCFAIIEKFKTWREEEKRRRIEKERSVAAAEVEEQDDGYLSDGDPPDYSDVDASAARQLHEEAIARSAPISSTGLPNPKVELIPEATKVVEKDFKSFFSKPYLREAALRKLRRSGRTVQAWGQPVPDVQEAEFVLGGMTPEELWGKEKMQDIMKAHERRKRRDRRVSKD